MNWAEIGAIFAGLALIEAPLIILAGVAFRWVRDVNTRLERIEQRSHLRRMNDPPIT